MTYSRVLLCISFFFFVGCGDDVTADVGAVDAISAGDAVGSADTGIDAVSVDAGSIDAGSIDATADVSPRLDGGSDASVADASIRDAGGPDVAPDVGSGCDTRVEDRVAGVCDGRGMLICTNWAVEHGGGTAVAQCVPSGGRCARADTCTDGRCTCGSEAECGDTEMCVSGFAGFSCVCISPL